MSKETESPEYTEEELMAIIEDGIKQVSDVVNEKYKQILEGKEVESPVLGDVFVNMKEAGTVAVAATDIFTIPLVDLDKDDETSRYSFMSEEQKVAVKNLMKSVVEECSVVYTSEVPDIEKLKTDIERLAENQTKN